MSGGLGGRCNRGNKEILKKKIGREILCLSCAHSLPSSCVRKLRKLKRRKGGDLVLTLLLTSKSIPFHLLPIISQIHTRQWFLYMGSFIDLVILNSYYWNKVLNEEDFKVCLEYLEE